jgi:two-component system, LytTR family, response regulator
MSNPIKAFIVDDEPLARRRLQRLVRADPDIRIVGSFESAAEAGSRAGDLLPQLLILDIRMPELDGFELLSTLNRQGFNPYVIFVTAHPDRSMDAFGVGAVDYLLKPFDEERLERALARAKKLIAANAGSDTGSAVPSSLRTDDPTRLLLTDRGKVVVLSLPDIEFIQSVARHVKIYADGRCHVCNQSLNELERRLSTSSFVRIHRSTVINVQHLAELHPSFHGDYEVVLKRGTRLPLSRRYRDRLAPFLLATT